MSPRAPRTALVTGASGFIGRTLARKLAAEGVETTCLVRHGALATFAPPPGARVVAVAAYEVPALASAIERARPEVVFHLSAAGVRPGERLPEALVDGHAGITVRLLDALRAAPPRRVLFAGSCSEYAPAEPPLPIAESHPLAPVSLYGAAKASAFLCGRAAARAAGIPIVALRLFGVFGPGEAPARLVPWVARALLAGERPALTPGDQLRDLTFVDDVAEAFLAAARSDALDDGEAYNVATGAAVRIREVAERTADACGASRDRLGFGELPYRPDETRWVVGDPARFRRATGWAPRTTLDEGIEHTVAWVRAGAKAP